MADLASIGVAVLALVCGAVGQERGAFAMRALAADDYREADVEFDLRAEQERLQTWLSAEGTRQRLIREPLAINLFNWLGAEQGGPLSPNLAWYPRKILPVSRDESRWGYSLAMPYADDRAVALFSEAEWNDGRRTQQELGFLLEFLPINMHDAHFTQNDVERESIRVNLDSVGRPAIGYTIKADRQDAYADWTESLIDKKAAIIVNGLVLTAPVFRGRIRSMGQISGDFTADEAEDLATSLRASVGTIDEGGSVADVLIRAMPDDPSNALAYAYRLLHDPDDQRRFEAATSLAKFGARARDAVPHLIRALSDRSLLVRSESVTALGMIGPPAKEAISHLESLTQDEDQQIVERAKAALRQIRGSTDPGSVFSPPVLDGQGLPLQELVDGLVFVEDGHQEGVPIEGVQGSGGWQDPV